MAVWENTDVDNTKTKQNGIKSGCESLLNRRKVNILTSDTQTIYANNFTV